MDSSDLAAFVVDEEQRIISANAAFRELVAREGVEPVGVTLGDVIRCINVVVEEQPCGKTTRCLYCALDQAFSETLRGRSRVGPFELQRTVFGEERPAERLYELCIRALSEGAEGVALITLKDLTESGREGAGSV
jgi:PAS domain-containing protein